MHITKHCPVWYMMIFWSIHSLYLLISPLASPVKTSRVSPTKPSRASPAKTSRQISMEIKPDTPAISSVKARMTNLSQQRAMWSSSTGNKHTVYRVFFFFPGGGDWGVNPFGKKFVNPPHPTLVPIFGPKFVPPPPAMELQIDLSIFQNDNSLKYFLCS